jgi:protein-L-isoaspartate(D-aspartate) O-methyltransferase
MVEVLRQDGGIANERVLKAMGEMPRHEFVTRRYREMAYYDMALPIGRGQTISPPSLVAEMVDHLEPQPGDRVLEVGTGTGYQAAVLGRLVAEVYTIEIVGALARRARSTLRRLGCANVEVRTGDGYLGWPEQAPFDGIIVACAPERVPVPLVDQLREGGRIVVPLGQGYDQMIYVFKKTNGLLARELVSPAAFVPMTGRAELDRDPAGAAVKPVLLNGSFEELMPGTSRPMNWYHQRQVTVTRVRDAPDGEKAVVFHNASRDRTAEVSQAFGLDGRRWRHVVLKGWARGQGIERGTSQRERASLVVAFYDERREILEAAAAGEWRGSFEWRAFEQRTIIPVAAREAVLRVGLCGATGELWVDDLEMTVGE